MTTQMMRTGVSPSRVSRIKVGQTNGTPNWRTCSGGAEPSSLTRFRQAQRMSDFLERARAIGEKLEAKYGLFPAGTAENILHEIREERP